MKKIITFLVCLTIVSLGYYAYDVTHVSKEEFSDLIKNHPLQKRLKLSEKERKFQGLPPNSFYDRERLLEMDPRTGDIYPENIEILKSKKTTASNFSSLSGMTESLQWKERGPNNIGGRTRVLFYDPNDTTGKRVFAGGVSGGLWVNDDITDANSGWTQIGIDENLAVTCYTIDPNDSDVWYIGTGEAFTDSDGTGNGLWKTENGGDTWAQVQEIDLINDDELERKYYVNQVLAWNNGGATEVFMSVDGAYDYDFVGYLASGWWKSTDDGVTFNRQTFNTTSGNPYVFADVEVAIDNSIWCATKNNLYGKGGGKIFRSTNGTTFTEKHSFTNGERVEIAVSKQDKDVVYAVAEVSSGVEVVKTTNGSSFTAITKPNDADTDIPSNDFTRGQAFYDLLLEVDPTDDTILYAGGIDLFRSDDSGASWSQISKWSSNNNLAFLNISTVHADMHTVTFNPLNSNQGVFGTDGGVYYSSTMSGASSSTSAISGRNKNYNITQFYSASIGQDANDETFLGGTQDNGSLFVESATSGANAYSDIYGGDGAQVFIDKDGAYAIPSYLYNYYSTQLLPITRDVNGNITNQIEIATDQSTGAFINVADLDDNKDILYADATTETNSSSTERIARYTNLTTTPVRTNFTNVALTARPTAIKVSPYTTASSTVFVGT
ncbi:hypothetical protein N9901_01630, partial [Flavobacteriaceae bacterium]|nr:hypothetical protein [Flavobacteriaceae bacterium]